MIELLAGAVATAPTVSTAPVPPPHHITLTWMTLGILLATVFTWLVFRWRTARLKQRQNSPRRLWRDLVRLHKLSWSDRQLLTQLARQLKLREPSRLFVEPELWREIVDTERSRRRRKRVAMLRSRLLSVCAI